MSTMKNPHDLSNLEFAAVALQVRLDKLQNPNTPLAQKLRLAINELKFLDQKEKSTPKNWWFVQYIGDEGQHCRADDLIPQERQRIANMIVRGFTAGEILPGAYDDEEEGGRG